MIQIPKPKTPMKCPHCAVSFHAEIEHHNLHGARTEDGTWSALSTVCPACQRSVIWLQRGKWTQGGAGVASRLILSGEPTMVLPMGSSRAVAPEVPKEIAADFLEACAVLPLSAKASAALSRRCLQAILEGHFRAKHRAKLSDQIQGLLDSKALPSAIAENVDAIRNIGNFAAHPEKDANAGTVVDVEPGEAEWNLDTLELLFDFCYVVPAKAAQKRAALDAKLAASNKPPMKTP